MTLQSWAVLAVLVAVFAAWKLAGVAWRMAKRMERHAERRAVDLVFAGIGWLIFGWWRNRRQDRQPARPQVLQGDDLFRTCTLSAWSGGPEACRWCDGPLPARRGGPLCSSKCDREYRRNHVFGGAGGAREAALERDGDACINCGSTVSPEVDHIDAALGRHGQVDCIHHLDNLRTLCGGGGQSCHQLRTNRQRRQGHPVRRRRRGAWT